MLQLGATSSNRAAASAAKRLRMQRFHILAASTPTMRAVRCAVTSATSTPSAVIAPYDGITSEPIWKRTGGTKYRIGDLGRRVPLQTRSCPERACREHAHRDRVYGSARSPQPSGWKTRTIDAVFFSSFETGRIGRGVRFPPQFGQRPRSLFSTQSRQKVHSKVQIIASAASGGRSLLQHSQLGRNSSIKICGSRRRNKFPEEK